MKALIYFRVLFLVSFALLVVAAALLFPRIMSGTTASLLLHFSPAGGASLVGGAGDAFGVLFAGFIIACANLIVGMELLPKARTLAMVIASANLLLSVLLFIAISVIISIN